MKIKQASLALITIIPICLYPIIFLYAGNINEVSFSQAVGPSLFFILIAGIIWMLFSVIASNVWHGSILASVFMIIILNYKWIENLFRKLLPNLRWWHIVPIIVVSFVCVAVVKRGKTANKKLCFWVSSIFIVLCIFNIIVAIKKIVGKITVEFTSQVNEKKVDNAFIVNKNTPNVYFLILDEYSNFNIMSKYYNYDNKVFEDFLTSNGFNISYNSRNNSSSTNVVTTNLLNLEYVVNDKTSDVDRFKMRKKPKLFDFFSSKGYTTYSIDNIGILLPMWKAIENAQYNFEVDDKSRNQFSKMVIEKTLFDKMVKKDYLLENKVVLQSLIYLKETSRQDIQPRLVYMHLLCPHVPFRWDETGQAVSIENSVNWKEKKYYLGQYKYITQNIMDCLKEIVANDPNSVIILQSDHSARSEKGGIVIEEEDKKEILNAVYYKGEPYIKHKDMSGLNTLRTVLSDVFKEDLKPLKE